MGKNGYEDKDKRECGSAREGRDVHEEGNACVGREGRSHDWADTPEGECLRVAYDIVNQSKGYLAGHDDGFSREPEGATAGRRARKRSLPSAEEVMSECRRYVKGQDEALEYVVDTCLFQWERRERLRGGCGRDELPPVRFLHLSGPSGSGKTASVRRVAKALGFGFVERSFATLTGEGWKGDSVSSALAEAARYLQEHGDNLVIVFFDECDKPARDEDRVRLGTANPTLSLLSVLDADGKYSFVPEGASAAVGLDTDSVVFVFAGCYDGIHEVVRRRLLGSGHEDAVGMDETELRSLAEVDDFVRYGQSPEFMGRAGVLVNLKKPGADVMREILTSPDGLWRRFDNMLGDSGRFEISPGAVDFMSYEAVRSGTGVRRLQAMLAPLGQKAVVASRGWTRPMAATVRCDFEANGLYLDIRPFGDGHGDGGGGRTRPVQPTIPGMEWENDGERGR